MVNAQPTQPTCLRVHKVLNGESCTSIGVTQNVPTYVTTLRLSIHVFVILTFMQIPNINVEHTAQPWLQQSSCWWRKSSHLSLSFSHLIFFFFSSSRYFALVLLSSTVTRSTLLWTETLVLISLPLLISPFHNFSPITPTSAKLVLTLLRER